MKEGLYMPKPQGHLDVSIEGTKPIIACVGPLDDYKEGDPTSKWQDKFRTGTKNLTDVDWYSSSGDRGGMVASEIDATNKKTNGLADCTSLIVTGIEKLKNGKMRNISFLTHQDPKEFSHDNKYNRKEEFVTHLNKLLTEMKMRCIPGTIDAVLAGGSYVEKGVDILGYPVANIQGYENSVKIIGEETKGILGFEPQVVNGPNITYQDDIYYDNDERRLYVIRPKVNPDVMNFPTSDLDKVKGDFPKSPEVKEQEKFPYS